MKEFFKREGESREQYINRMYSSKIENNLTNKECADLINKELGTNYQESYLRGIYKNYSIGFDDGYEKALNKDSEGSLLLEIEEKKMDLVKERKKLQATKLELNRKLTHDARFELFYENIKEVIETLPLPNFKPIYETKNNKVGYVECFTDIHYGANFKTETNEYSRDICKQRFEKMLAKTIEYCQKENVDEINIVNNSDSIQGMIHMSDIKINEVPVVQAVVEISRIIANYLNKLSAFTKIKYHHVMQSNHAQIRPLGSKASELATEDMELVIANYIKDLLADNDRIEVILSDKDYIDFNVCGYDIIGMHGHQIKGINNVIQKYSMLHKKFYQYCLLGHTHAGQTMVVGAGENNSIEVLVTPSIVGSCPYSAKLGLDAKAMSKIYKFEEGYGLTQTNNIILN